MMKRILIFLSSVLMLCSCGICRHLSPRTEVSIRDSISVHYKDSIRIIDKVVTRDSVVFIELPSESSQNILPTIAPSHLETSLAVSDAYVDSLGLHHSLKNKREPIPVTVPVTEHTQTIDHNTESNSSSALEHSETNTIPVEVEKPLKWWQKFRIKAFWWLVLAVVIGFRKELFALIQKFL